MFRIPLPAASVTRPETEEPDADGGGKIWAITNVDEKSLL